MRAGRRHAIYPRVSFCTLPNFITANSVDCHSKTYVSLAEILKTLLLGVLRSNVSSPELIEAILSVKRRNIEHLAVQLDVQVLWSTLNSVLGVLLNDVVYLVIDNFTMKHSEGEELMKLVSDTTPHGIGRKGLIKLIMTSVYSPRCISRRGTIISALVMDPVTMQHDIQCFMTAVLKGERESVVTERNYDGILEDCHGTFAYAVAAREYLARKSTIDGVTGRLPTWLWGVFDELMAPNIEDSRCQQVLRIIAVAARPLRVKELECILGALGAGDCECNDSKSFCLATAIPHACIPFLKVSAGCIHFSHPKLRNYMAHSNRLGESETHGILAEKCIEFACTEDKCSSSEAEQEGAQYLNLSARDPFLQYAVRYWSHHLLLSCSEASSRHTATSLGAKIKNIAWMEKAQGDLIQSTQEMESYLRDNLEAQRRMGFRLKDIMKSIVEVASVANMRGDVLYSIELLSSVSEDTQFKTASIEEQYHILSTLGRCYSRASQWQNAERYCRQSIDLYNAYPEKEVREMIRTQSCLGWIIRAQNRLVDASRIFMRSYVASKQRLGLDDDETILALTQTVHLYEQRGKCGVPMKLLLLHLWASALDHGVEHRSITRTLSIIIELANQRERSHEAENTCLKLLEASKLRHRPNVSLGIVLAGLYGRQSKWFEATELLSTLAHHPEIYNRADLAFRVLVNLADAQMANGSWVQALTTLSTCTPSVLSREDNQQLQTKRARCEEALGRSENAEKILREMLDEEKKIGQWRTRTVFNIGEELTAFYERQNVLEMALEVYQEIYHGYITALGQNHRYAIATNTAIADLLERRLEWTKAQHKQQDIAAITVASRGISHHRVKQAQRKSLIAGLHAIVA
jgi:tetratricopeptide (TPR) repeat protein